jgi:GTP-binding protein EngB required for normal cell division
MSTNKFVEQSMHYYMQMESYGFAQTMLENYFLMHDCTKLHAYFNKLFNDTFMAKEQEMILIQTKSDKIHYIDSELKLMFGEHVPHLPADPQWHPKVRRDTNNVTWWKISGEISTEIIAS